MSPFIPALAFGLLAVSNPTPEQFVQKFMDGLWSDQPQAFEQLFLPDPDLRAQAKSIYTLVGPKKLEEKRIYSAPDFEPRYALVRIRTVEDDKSVVFILGLRIILQDKKWLVAESVTLTRVELGSASNPESVRNEIRILTAMLEGVGEFVEEMKLIYGPGKKR